MTAKWTPEREDRAAKDGGIRFRVSLHPYLSAANLRHRTQASRIPILFAMIQRHCTPSRSRSWFHTIDVNGKGRRRRKKEMI
jgi:hypothetical protein